MRESKGIPNRPGGEMKVSKPSWQADPRPGPAPREPAGGTLRRPSGPPLPPGARRRPAAKSESSGAQAEDLSLSGPGDGVLRRPYSGAPLAST